MPKKTRLQFDFTNDVVEGLDAIKDWLGVATRAETVRLALQLLDRVTTKAESGSTLVLTHEDGSEDIIHVPGVV